MLKKFKEAINFIIERSIVLKISLNTRSKTNK